MVYRLIAPQWLIDQDPSLRRVWEGEFDEARIKALNETGYNIYYLPNYPSHYEPGKTVDGSQIDTFRFVFVDFDLKSGAYPSKEAFVEHIKAAGLDPSFIVDSGGGVHAYWRVEDLEAMSFLKIQRRLIAKFNTDEAVGQIYQLMRVPGTFNTKLKDEPRKCDFLYTSDAVYTCDTLDAFLPALTLQDEEYCKQHYGKTYNRDRTPNRIDAKVPQRFLDLLNSNNEVKEIWSGDVDDRSKADYRLGHIMFGAGLTKEEALSVLVNTSKALERAPTHRCNYAENIVDKIWTYEQAENKSVLTLSTSVRDILSKGDSTLKGQPFRCHKWIDDTEHGFRLGQIIGLVAGSGVGKTAVALNMFYWFVKNNPDYVHFFVSLEQPKGEIAARWRTMCGEETHLQDKVHVIDNYDENGEFRHLSLETIKQYLVDFQKQPNTKAGCVVIDHIGALRKGAKDGRQSIEDICHRMKDFAVSTNTMLVMQSQAPREKASIGDIELDKDAAYGTVFFESYCDYLMTIWQPLKRCYEDPKCPTVVAYKFCKIRHKRKNKDRIQEDARYLLYFDPSNEQMREMTDEEEKAFDFWNKQAVNKRGMDKKTDVVPYTSTRLGSDHDERKIDTSRNSGTITRTQRVS